MIVLLMALILGRVAPVIYFPRGIGMVAVLFEILRQRDMLFE